MIDALACESQFRDHLAPVWAALPQSARGRFLVAPELAQRTVSLGIEPAVIDAQGLRETPQHPPVHDGMPALVCSIGDIKIGRRIGYGPFVFLEHGAGQGYDGHNATMASYPGGPDRDDNAVFLVPNEYSARRWRAKYPNAVVEVVGCPKLDSLPSREGDGSAPTVALSFHGDWPRGTPYGGTALYEYSERLAALAKRFDVIGHGHPGQSWGQTMKKVYDRAGIEFVPEFDDVLRRADVYVCDNSSTIFEFASTGRPVVLLNAAVWHRKGGPGLRFWDAAHVGINVWPRDDLPSAIEEALRDSPERQAAREDALDIVYAYRHGGAERAAAAVVAWLAGRESVAA